MYTKGANQSLKAFFSASIGPFMINDMRLIEGSKGMFVGFPSKKYTTADGVDRWSEYVSFVRDSTGKYVPDAAKLANQLLEAAVAEYERRQQDVAKPAAAVAEDDDLPF
jgi:DNA-binding cell septation regulator SpoVG